MNCCRTLCHSFQPVHLQIHAAARDELYLVGSQFICPRAEFRLFPLVRLSSAHFNWFWVEKLFLHVPRVGQGFYQLQHRLTVSWEDILALCVQQLHLVTVSDCAFKCWKDLQSSSSTLSQSIQGIWNTLVSMNMDIFHVYVLNAYSIYTQNNPPHHTRVCQSAGLHVVQVKQSDAGGMQWSES